jgi:hypothetical protein
VVKVIGIGGERVTVTALRPVARGEWKIVTQDAHFPSACAMTHGRACTVNVTMVGDKI